MDEKRLELKVGVLALGSLAALVALLWFMGELSFTSGQRVLVDFAHTGNVVKGAPVKLGGIAVGKVDAVELLAERRDPLGSPLLVRMALTLTPAARAVLKVDATVTISSQGPLGEPYLELWPGLKDAPLASDGVLRGTDAPRIDLVSNRLANFLEAASTVLEKDPQALTKLVGGVTQLTQTVDGMLVDNRADVRELTTQLAAAAKDLRAVAVAARTQLEPNGKASGMIDDAAAVARMARADWPELSKKASTAIGGLAAVSGQFTEEDGQKIKALVAKFQQAGERLDGLGSRAEKLLTRLEAGDGTLGALLKDKQAYDDLKSLLADLRKHPWKMLWKD